MANSYKGTTIAASIVRQLQVDLTRAHALAADDAFLARIFEHGGTESDRKILARAALAAEFLAGGVR